jgi:superfamily I DNA/RNA helicase
LRNELILSRLFGSFVYGPEELLLSTLPAIFKRYRQENLYDEAARGSALRDAIDEGELQKLRNRPDAPKVLHPDEAELLLALLFRLVQSFYRVVPSRYATSTHPYIQAYRQHCRPLVAVDEASDYSPLQLACITLLAHPRFTCVTLVGDLMQRLGARGLGSWDEYTALFTETEVCSFEVSYRQPKPLLEIASSLYAAQHGVTRPYRLSEHAQSVLNLRAITHAPNLDAEGRLDWLVARLYDANNLLPEANLAVLVRNQEAADSLKLAINEHPDFQARGGTARVCAAGSVGQANTLRIFPLDLIKGLEFDGVFIWEADQLDQGSADQLDLQRLVYVAISRASIFLGLSYVEQFPATLTSVKELFVEADWQSQVRNSQPI